MTLHNFGRNVRFEPARVLTPADRNGVLACLDQWRGGAIRAFGGLHSWSQTAVAAFTALDLRHLDKVAIQTLDDGTLCVEIEGGCTIDAVLDYLRPYGYTLPTYGIIGKQTIAGAIATATHGSGPSSLSHYPLRVSVAAYNPRDGRARVYEWDGGDALLAARCALGCAGIVLSVRMPIVPDDLIDERLQWFERLDQVLDCERENPRQQFYLIPWSWTWLAQLRRPVEPGSGGRPGVSALLDRVFFRFLGVDVVMNGVVRLLAGYAHTPAGIRAFYRRVFPVITGPGKRVIDRSHHLLRMRHDLYRHVEMELFVPAPHLRRAIQLVEWVLRWCGGESPAMPDGLADDDFGRDVAAEARALSGSYVHDYPITIRRVLADDTLISMTGGGEAGPWYAVSLITYQRDRAPFLRIAGFLAAAMASAYGARPHWGKICPLGTADLAALYPALPRFRAHCASVDPHQVFVNDFARRALGFEGPSGSGGTARS